MTAALGGRMHGRTSWSVQVAVTVAVSIDNGRRHQPVSTTKAQVNALHV